MPLRPLFTFSLRLDYPPPVRNVRQKICHAIVMLGRQAGAYSPHGFSLFENSALDRELHSTISADLRRLDVSQPKTPTTQPARA